MGEAFEQIARIDRLIAAAMTGTDGNLLGWCANSAIPPETLLHLCGLADEVLDTLRGQMREALVGSVALGERTLIFRQYPAGVLVIWLDSPVNDEVLDWLWRQVDSALRQQRIATH